MNYIKSYNKYSKITEDLDSLTHMPGGGEKKRFWDFVDKADWKSDHDYKRIGALLKSEYEGREIDSIRNAYEYYMEELEREFGHEGGFGVGDDGWSDLRAEVIGRGQEFFESITSEKLRDMGNSSDYKENFGYLFQ